MSSARESEASVSTGQESPPVIRHFSLPCSSLTDDAAPHPASRHRLGSSGNVDIAALLDNSSDSDSSSLCRGVAPKAASVNAKCVSRPGRSASHVADMGNNAALDVAAIRRGLQHLRSCVVSSSATELSVTSHATSRSSSSHVLPFRRLRMADATATATAEYQNTKALLADSPSASPIHDMAPHSPSAAKEDSATPPKTLDNRKVTGDSPRRSSPQSFAPVASMTQPSAASFTSPAFAETSRDQKRRGVAAHLLPSPEKPQCSGRRPSAATTRQSSAQTTKRSRAASAKSRAPVFPSQQQSENAEGNSPSSGKNYRIGSQWFHHKKMDGTNVACVRVTNPTALYDRGIQVLEKKLAKRNAMRAQLEEAAMAEATFHPCISRRVKSVKDRGDGASLHRDSSAQLRYRLRLLELPGELRDDTHRYTPRLSRATEKIVRACRARSGAELPPEERLYRDYFHRQQATKSAEPVTSQPAIVRSRQDIDAHIAELHSFEHQRQRAIAAAREACVSASANAHRRLHIDPQSLVERLTRKRSPSQRRMTAAQGEKVQYSFQPQTSASAAELAHHARLRGVHRWVRYFCGADTLLITALAEFRGEAVHEAATLFALLQRHKPFKVEWSVAELANAFTDDMEGRSFVADLWHRRPPVSDASARASELTFRPRLNPQSAIIVDKMEAEHRCGPAYDRLFLSARVKQLSRRQQELEEEQVLLESKQSEELRRQRLQVAWRAQEAHRLEVYRNAKAKDQCSSDTVEVTAARERCLSQISPCSHQPFAPPSSPQSGSVGSIGEQTSAVTSTCAILEPSSSTPPVSLTASFPPPQAELIGVNSIVSATTDPESGRGDSGTLSSCCASASLQMTSPTRITPEAQSLACTSTGGIEGWCEADTKELERAAEVLRGLLGISVGCNVGAPQAPPAEPPARLPQASTCFPSCDLNRRSLTRGKVDSRSIGIVLQCAQMRDPQTFLSCERGRIDRAQKRQLHDLGRLLYNHHKSMLDKNRS